MFWMKVMKFSSGLPKTNPSTGDVIGGVVEMVGTTDGSIEGATDGATEGDALGAGEMDGVGFLCFLPMSERAAAETT